MAFGKHIGKHAKHAKPESRYIEIDEGAQGVVPAAAHDAADDSVDVAETVEMAPAVAMEAPAEQPAVEQAEDVPPVAVEAADEVLVAEEGRGAHGKRSLDIPEIAAASDDAEEADEAEDLLDDEEAIAGFTPAFDLAAERKPRKVLKGVGIALGVIVGVLAIVYVAGIAVFSNWFLPNTTIGPVDVSLKSSDEAVELIDAHVKDYKLDVVGGNFSYRTTAEKLGLSADSHAIVQGAHDDLSAWKWPVLLVEGAHDESGSVKLSYLESATSIDVKQAVETFNEGAEPPQNACVAYDEKKDMFVVQPEVAGTRYEPERVVKALDAGVRGLSPKVQLSDEQLVQPTVLATDPRLTKAATEASKMISAHLKLSLAGISGGEVGPDQLHGLVSIDDDFNVKIDEDVLAGWVDELVEGYNTVGSERTYTRPDGKVITVDGGAYGWEVDSEALREEVLQGIREGSNREIEIPCSMIGTAWNGVGQVDWGNRYIDVDLSEQYVRFYDDNSEIIWESPCITGTPDGMHNTVEGVWYVTGKESPSKLVGWEFGKKIYETTVRWWMPFEGNGIGFHDADWQPAFGGYLYASGYGSHGCVNLPVYAAEELWYIIEVDDVVIVHW